MGKTKKTISSSIEELIENYVNSIMNPEEIFSSIQEVVQKEVDSKLKDFKPESSVKQIQILQGKKIECAIENQPQEFESILQYASNKINLLLVGGAGTGKGIIAENIAKTLKADFFEVPACQLEHQWEGFVDANGNYKATEFYLACKNASEGKKTVLLLDELDCCDPCTLKHFNDCFERKWYRFPNNEKLDFKENLILIAAANTFGTGANMQYIGNQLDSSTLDRFTVKEIFYDDNIQMLLTGNNENLVKFFNALRSAADKASLKIIVSYRSLKTVAKMESIIPLTELLKESLFKNLGADDLQILYNLMKLDLLTSNKYFKAMNELIKQDLKLVATA